MEQLQLFIMLFIVAIVIAVMMGFNPLSMLRDRSMTTNNTVTPNLNIVASI